VSLRLLCIGLLVVCACASEPRNAGACAERLSFYDRPDLYRIATFPGGYVIDDRGALVGLDLHDEEQFRIPPTRGAFALARDGEIVTASLTESLVTVDAWSTDGESLGEIGRLEDGRVREREGVAILADGSALLHGGESGAWWTSRVRPGGASVIVPSASRRHAAVAAGGDEAYVVTSTVHDELLSLELVELSRIDGDDDVVWSATLFDRVDPSAPLEMFDLLASAGGDAFVVTRDATAGVFTILRFGPDGTLLWTREEPETPTMPPGLPFVDSGGSLVWIDHADGDLRLRWVDGDGSIRCEERFVGDGLRLSDVDAIGDELFVVQIDRLNRFRLREPSG
jgi:hypothetical protein